MRKLDFEKQMGEIQAEHLGGAMECRKTCNTFNAVTEATKVTITPFSGDYKDWLRFGNQFTVEVDGSAISEISKFNYVPELVRGKQNTTS